MGVIDWDTAFWGDPGVDFYTVNMRSLDRVALKASYRHATLWRDPHHLLRQKFYKLYQLLKVVFIYTVRLSMKSEGNSYHKAILDYLNLIEAKPFEVIDLR
jgi:aminoglycoside phosphotransferase (APT) family kinase protein